MHKNDWHIKLRIKYVLPLGITIIYTIILLKYVCLSVIANCRSQFLLVRLGRCLYLFVSSDSTSCHEFASQFVLALLYAKNVHKLSRIPTLAHVAVERTSGTGNNAVTVELPATRRSRNNCGNTSPRQIEPQQRKSTSRNEFITSQLEQCGL